MKVLKTDIEEAEFFIAELKEKCSTKISATLIIAFIYRKFWVEYEENERFDIIDKILETIVIEHFSDEILLGLLTGANLEREHLKCYDGLFNKVREKIRKEDPNENLEELFYGLD